MKLFMVLPISILFRATIYNNVFRATILMYCTPYNNKYIILMHTATYSRGREREKLYQIDFMTMSD